MSTQIQVGVAVSNNGSKVFSKSIVRGFSPCALGYQSKNTRTNKSAAENLVTGVL